MVISDAACTTLSTTGVALELNSSTACGTHMPLAEALDLQRGQHPSWYVVQVLHDLNAWALTMDQVKYG